MFENISERLKERAQNIQMIVLDVDGVLTDGSIFIGEQSEMLKKFNVKDGYGIVMAQKFGLKMAIISGKYSQFTQIRGTDLGIKEVHHGITDKLICAEALLARHGLTFEEMAYIGDDMIDVPVLEKAALSACPADRHYCVDKHIHYITERKGGEGAVREFIDLILYCKGMLPD